MTTLTGYVVKIPRPQRDLGGQDLYSSSGTCVPCKTPDVNRAWVFCRRWDAETRAAALPQMKSEFPGCRPQVLEVRRTTTELLAGLHTVVATEILGLTEYPKTNDDNNNKETQ